MAWLGFILQENSCFTPRYRCVLRISLQPILTSRLTATSSQKVALQRAVRRLKHRAETTMKWGQKNGDSDLGSHEISTTSQEIWETNAEKMGCRLPNLPNPPNDFTALVAPPRRIEIRPWRQWHQQSLPCPAATCQMKEIPASQACNPAKTKIGTIVYFNDTFYASMLFLLAMPDAQQNNRTAAWQHVLTSSLWDPEHHWLGWRAYRRS